jgi:hypothetical protein
LNDRLVLALRPWTYSEIGALWSGLLGLMIVCVLLQAFGHARRGHQLMAAAGAVITGRFLFHLVTHYLRCAACSVVFDVSPNASSWSVFYDYAVCCLVLGVFAWREANRFAIARPAAWTAAIAVVPLVAGPLFFAQLHERETSGATPTDTTPRYRKLYFALVVVAAPFVMPALPRDHFGDLGGEFFWDGTSTQANTYMMDAVLLMFGQIFLFTLPRTRGLLWQTAGLFLAFNCLAAYLALFLAYYELRFVQAPRFQFALGGSPTQIGAILAGNLIAAGFGVTLRYTTFVIKSPERVCQEGQATREQALPRCLTDLEAALPVREAAAHLDGANALALALPEETRACVELAKRALAATEGGRRDLTQQLGQHHGSDLVSCQEAASANYAVLNECAEHVP